MMSELAGYLEASKEANQLISLWDKHDEKPIEKRDYNRFHQFIIKQIELKLSTNFKFLIYLVGNTLQHVKCKERLKVIFAVSHINDEEKRQDTLQKLIAGLNAQDSQTLLHLLTEIITDNPESITTFAHVTGSAFYQINEINRRYQEDFINIIREHPFIFAADLLYPHARNLANALHRTIGYGSRDALSIFLAKVARLPYTLSLPLLRLTFNSLSEMCEAWPETLTTMTLSHEYLMVTYTIQQLLLVEASEQILSREGCHAYPKVHAKILSNIICVHQEDYINLLHDIENEDSASLYEVFVLGKLIEKIYQIAQSMFPASSEFKQKADIAKYNNSLKGYMTHPRFCLNHFINDSAFDALATKHKFNTEHKAQLLAYYKESIQTESLEGLASYIEMLEDSDEQRASLTLIMECCTSKYFEGDAHSNVVHIEDYCKSLLNILAHKAEKELIDNVSELNPSVRKRRKKRKKKKEQFATSSEIAVESTGSQSVNIDPQQSSSSSTENTSVATTNELAELNRDDLAAEIRLCSIAKRKVNLYQHFLVGFERLNDIIFTAPTEDAEAYLKLHLRIRELLKNSITYYSKHIPKDSIHPLMLYEMKTSTLYLTEQIRTLASSARSLEDAFKLHNQLVTALYDELPLRGIEEYSIDEIEIRQNIDELLYMPKWLMDEKQSRAIEWLKRLIQNAESLSLERFDFKNFKPGFLVGGIYGGFISEKFTRIFYQPSVTTEIPSLSDQSIEIDCVIYINKQLAPENTINVTQMSILRSIFLHLMTDYNQSARFLNGITTWHDIKYLGQPCDITLQENPPIPVLSHCALMYKINDGVVNFLENGQHTLQHLRSNRVQIIAPINQHLDFKVMAHVVKKILYYLISGATLTVHTRQILGKLFSNDDIARQAVDRLYSFYANRSAKLRAALTINPPIPIIDAAGVENSIHISNYKSISHRMSQHA